MLFEDLFYDDDETAPASLSSVSFNQNGRTIQMLAEYLADGEVVRWNRTAEVRRLGGTGRLGEQRHAISISP
jgi:hypothetical protein